MNAQDMTDAEIYEFGLDILLDKLGPAGLIQFFRQCKPCTSDYTAERQKLMNDDAMDVKTIVKRIQKKRKLAGPKNMSQKNIDDMSGIEIYKFGLKAISLRLGPVGIVRFVHLFDTNGYAYTVDQFKVPNANEPGTDTGVVKEDHYVMKKKLESETE